MGTSGNIKGSLLGVEVLLHPDTIKYGGSWEGYSADNPVPYDPQTIMFFKKLLDKFLYPFFVDVGASTGSYSLLPVWSSRIQGVAFEPNPFVASVLHDNLVLNTIEGFVEIHATPLSDRKKIVTLRMPVHPEQCGLTLIEGNPQRYSEWVDVPMLACPLDYYDLLSPPNVIKVDVEGYETLVLQGAEQTIRHEKPYLILEFEERNMQQHGLTADNLLEFLDNVNYAWEHISPIDLFAYPKDKK